MKCSPYHIACAEERQPIIEKRMEEIRGEAELYFSVMETHFSTEDAYRDKKLGWSDDVPEHFVHKQAGEITVGFIETCKKTHRAVPWNYRPEIEEAMQNAMELARVRGHDSLFNAYDIPSILRISRTRPHGTICACR